MTDQVFQQDGYISEDRNAQLRRAACACCGACKLYIVKDSIILGHVVESCGAVDLNAPNGHHLSDIMLRLAAQGSCPQQVPLGTPE